VTEIHAAASCYAVNALDRAELVEFEAHLATCPTCRDEVAELGHTAAQLASLNLATPPHTLRNTILAAIRNTPQLAGDDAPNPRPAPEFDELASRRQRQRTRVLGVLVAAMLALAVGLGGVIYAMVPERQNQVARTALDQDLYSAPDAVRTTTELPGGGQVTFIASRQLNRALFLGTNLPEPGRNRYQLWTGTGSLSVKGGITRVARDRQIPENGPGITVFFTGNVADADFLAVNLEAAGSVPAAPTSPVLAAGPTT
jgi:anti-sigma-K factor RskA